MLLAISMSWAAVAIALMGAVYKYRRLKVFKVASPTFLCVTLLGCAIMYAEVITLGRPYKLFYGPSLSLRTTLLI